MKNPKLEIACFNLASAIIAQAGGADRIELCDQFREGGTTPEFSVVEEARKKISIELLIMIRPRGGNFVYSDAEFNQMTEDIVQLKKLNVDGFVFGILNTDNTINIEQNKELVKLAQPLPCSFHRAFDKTPNAKQALQEIIDCGFKTILTSGHQAAAIAGLDELKELVQLANDSICIMPGGGVRSTNIKQIKEYTHANYYHSSAIIENELANMEEVTSLKEQLS
ncbi:MAG: copper homeostasis protein CutC [Bacteroidetes bacterium]|nr:copper homeostasis protein CutC [Bacteroidota bacterium]